MLKQSLNGTGTLEIIGKDSGLLPKGIVSADIPGSVYATLLKEELIPDPYYRDNELKVLPLMDNDFVYRRTFTAEESLFECEEVLLRFDGIDTLADVYLNEELLGSSCNMHRIWEFEVLDVLKHGKNELKVVIYSPTKYIKEENEKVYTGGSHECMKGFPHLRKAHCMFGWDWGPRLPDAGIFRDVMLLGIQKARFESVYITQEHETTDVADALANKISKVTLDFDIVLELFRDCTDTNVKITVTAPDGTIYEPLQQKQDIEADNGDYRVVIDSPLIWWPRGYGEQPLYTVKAELFDEAGSLLDVWERRIGLRTVTMNTDKDEWGNCFAHEVNGVKIFAMGADYIPEDNLFSRITKERTRKLLSDAAEANHNCIRIWGGGYYPDDYFFDACDELGLLVWIDFMFACASYELDDAFEANIRAEVVDNVRRIRHHACLALWCGNNEMETQTLDEAWEPSIKQKYDYIKIFEYIIPQVLKEEDPVTFYWPSSPSSGGNYDNPWDEDRGDTHYWDVWHGNKPFTEYRKFRFRYLSEFGFQSFPCLKTVKTFAEEEDLNIFSRVMEMHQRNVAANGKILNYLSATYRYPECFENLLYASQLLQADAIRYGVEHFRRWRGRCMGAVVWQLNDIWPVASWASIDYYGRWKALHYAEKKMFAPVMISCEEIGELSERPFCITEPAPIEKSAKLHVANETMQPVTGVVEWELCKPNSEVIIKGCQEITVPALDGVWLNKLDFNAYDEREIHLSYRFKVNGKVVSANSCLFTPPKHYYFENPKLSVIKEGKLLTISASAYAKNVELEAVDGDCKLSDNYFDMEAGTYTVEILEGNATEFRCKSVFDI
ncbi:MAG: glycoside hydrolase family 2 protein [Lachnospiraceae bacterium]|nr:glycoside hydrolase family 2 protein [Lachnospiraceae bacterium]